MTILDCLTDRRVRLVVAWLLLVGAVGQRGYAAWINFKQAENPNGNDGHTSIDFGGQWMMGRLLVLGHGRELYSRETHRTVARDAFGQHDGDRLVGWYPGAETDTVAGPLYPPVHAFVMAPAGLIADPYLSYRITQLFLFGCLCFAGLGVRYMSNGRWWWSMATAILFLYPGCRGGLDLAQNSAITVTILIWGWALVVRGRRSWGGLIWGLLAFKPVWAVSFLAALLLLRQWRAAASMALTGLGLVLLSIPFVGVQSWYDWLHVGQAAAANYNVDRNWIFLSRDLFGIPRRMLLEFVNGQAVRDRPIAAVAGWALWGTVAAISLFVIRRARKSDRLVGPLPAFVFLAAWLCTYRFMYYDASVAVIAVFVLLADFRPYFRHAWWPARSWAVVFVALMLVFENGTVPLNIEFTASIMVMKSTATLADSSTALAAPTFYFATGDYYPWDTLAVVLLWGWCGVELLRQGRSAIAARRPES